MTILYMTIQPSAFTDPSKTLLHTWDIPGSERTLEARLSVPLLRLSPAHSPWQHKLMEATCEAYSRMNLIGRCR